MKTDKKTKAWIPLIVAVSIVAGIAIGFFLTRQITLTDGQRKLAAILDLIDSEYVETVDLDSLLEQTYPDLLSNLDPHTVYIPASDLQSVNDDLDGSFSGVGISFTLHSDTITVNEVIPGGPSEKAGLMPGDRIVSVNDSIVAGKGITNTQVQKMLRGEKGTTVSLGIKRKTAKEILNFDIVRGDIPVNTVLAEYIIEDKVGYIKVSKFGRTTYDEFLTALARLAGKGAESYIIDLRGNGGGLMDVAILMANEFLPAGAPIVSTRGRKTENDRYIGSDGLGSFQKAQVVVLLDEYSASASEIFAGALQDNDRGLIVGRRSFGKGLVQHQVTLPDSSAMRITVARYYTPSGRSIQKDYKPGQREAYERELLDRYDHGEFYESDSIKFNTDLQYTTAGGRTVYGGGGIMPDVFVPNDTTNITSYYINLLNSGSLYQYAFDFSDRNRDWLSTATDVDELMRMLPYDDELLQGVVAYASSKGLPARWYYINISAPVIVNNLKALIANDILGQSYSYQVSNTHDATVLRALSELHAGNAVPPINDSRNPVKSRRIPSLLTRAPAVEDSTDIQQNDTLQISDYEEKRIETESTNK
ncbi:MAG: PDZ domain-containing protein [Muribaculum sp.]|nr:PDZ domain-containing protein [Muribaculum sp.]